jgi:hypothetical protein
MEERPIRRTIFLIMIGKILDLLYLAGPDQPHDSQNIGKK